MHIFFLLLLSCNSHANRAQHCICQYLHFSILVYRSTYTEFVTKLSTSLYTVMHVLCAGSPAFHSWSLILFRNKFCQLRLQCFSMTWTKAYHTKVMEASHPRGSGP